MQNEIPLLYDFIKLEVEQQPVIFSENVIVALSNDISYKIHELALLSRSIMLKSNRNFLKDEDVQNALKLSFKNILIVPKINENEEKLKSAHENEEVTISVSSHSISSLNPYYKYNFRQESGIVFSKLLKALLSNKEAVYKHSLQLIQNKNDIDDVILMLLTSFNIKLDHFYDEEFYIRICSILEAVVKNKSLSLSENPWKDLCISLSLKLLWSPMSVTLKFARVTRILQHIISRQYLMSKVIENMVIDLLLKDLGKFQQDHSHCSGSLVGLIRLKYIVSETIETLIDQINLFSFDNICSSTIKEAVLLLLYVMKVGDLFIHVPYMKVFHLIDTFFCAESIPWFISKICDNSTQIMQHSSLNHFLIPTVLSSNIVPYVTVSKEIDILLHGGSIDDLTIPADEMDDLPPLLFRKPHIQPPSSDFTYSVQDIGFNVQIKRPVKIIFAINGVNNLSLENNREPFISEFHTVFLRRRQFIENRARIKTKPISVLNRKICRNNSCVMYSLFYAI